MGIAWYLAPDCASLPPLVSLVPSVDSTSADVWQASSTVATPAADLVSFRVIVRLFKSTDAAVEVEVDDLFVRPDDEIFSDSFEIGERCRWSTTTP
jgi:hypothetical protein